MALRRSFTAVVERNVRWQGDFATEPYEAAWASEAIFFVRALEVEVSAELAGTAGVQILADVDPLRFLPVCSARVQISADGIHWADEGSDFILPLERDAVTFCKVKHFGGFLRLVGELPSGLEIRVLVSLVLKE